MLIGNGVRSYEAGEVWHLLDTRVHMPITKISLSYFNRISLDDYNVLIMVSGNYKFDPKITEKIKNWISKGNTLITIGTANNWIIKNKIVKEELVVKKKDTLNKKLDRKPYVDASENYGREKLGGVFLEVNIDKSHPIAFGYKNENQVVYKNNLVWLKPSKNSYSNVTFKPNTFFKIKRSKTFVKIILKLFFFGLLFLGGLFYLLKTQTLEEHPMGRIVYF